MTSPQLEKDGRTGLWYRPGTMDLFMIGELGCYRPLNPRPGDTILDVGACIGSVSRYLAENGANVVAYEPHPENFDILVKNSPDSVNVRAAVIAGPDGQIILYANEKGINDGLHSTTPHRGRTELSCPAVNFHDQLDRYEPNKLKIDCEGSEYDILAEPLPGHVEKVAMELHLTRPEWRAAAKPLHRSLIAQGFRARREPRLDTKAWTAFGVYER